MWNRACSVFKGNVSGWALFSTSARATLGSAILDSSVSPRG